MVRRSGGAGVPDAQTAPVTWQPAWLVHTERGDAGGGVEELGARLPLPAYGLAMGDAIGPAATLEDLAAAYAQVRKSQVLLQAVNPLPLSHAPVDGGWHRIHGSQACRVAHTRWGSALLAILATAPADCVGASAGH